MDNPRNIFSSNIFVKTAIMVCWVAGVCALGIGTAGNSLGWPAAWVLMAGVALLPPLVLSHLWRVPEATMSQRIDSGRR